MKEILFILILIVRLLFPAAAAESTASKTDNDRDDYAQTVRDALEDELWNSRDAYDACMYLMVPMHYAFQMNHSDETGAFTNLFERFAASLDSNSTYFENGDLYKLHWLYFSSQYMKLMCQNDRSGQVPDGLYEFVNKEIIYFWNNYRGGYKAEFHGMEEVLQAVLYGDGYSIDKSYRYAVCDMELFMLAIMCDMAVLDDYFSDEANQTIHNKAPQWAKRMMEGKVEWQADGGWLFGVGDMTDHRDYLYAGNADIIENMEQAKDHEVVGDSSHFSRMPLFLISWRDAQTEQADYEYFERLRKGLAIQFTNHVLFLPDEDIPYIRMTNYMDGKNGVYRYSYHEEGVGYGPWELSNALLNGWWAGLNDEDVTQAYQILLEQVPFCDNVKNFYASDVTIRERNENLTSWESKYCRIYCAANLHMD